MRFAMAWWVNEIWRYGRKSHEKLAQRVMLFIAALTTENITFGLLILPG